MSSASTAGGHDALKRAKIVNCSEMLTLCTENLRSRGQERWCADQELRGSSVSTIADRCELPGYGEKLCLGGVTGGPAKAVVDLRLSDGGSTLRLDGANQRRDVVRFIRRQARCGRHRLGIEHDACGSPGGSGPPPVTEEESAAAPDTAI